MTGHKKQGVIFSDQFHDTYGSEKQTDFMTLRRKKSERPDLHLSAHEREDRKLLLPLMTWELASEEAPNQTKYLRSVSDPKDGHEADPVLRGSVSASRRSP